MRKYLQFIDGGDDAATYPADRLISMTCAANATLLLHFESSVGKSDGGDTIALTITADTEKDVMKTIIQAINYESADKALIVVADDVKSQYLDARITACTITLDT